MDSIETTIQQLLDGKPRKDDSRYHCDYTLEDQIEELGALRYVMASRFLFILRVHPRLACFLLSFVSPPPPLHLHKSCPVLFSTLLLLLLLSSIPFVWVSSHGS